MILVSLLIFIYYTVWVIVLVSYSLYFVWAIQSGKLPSC